ncbi:acyl carrier protein [Paenibacillus arenosi]|uniref:Acyl carrier protein n=1 Tax=Paenibacillus arenosi TaxID=2774142 RepID=A0ABR9AS58_9BACL|nr:acyl carrier protein [Paenibacillus arenosi]MBD8496938.1 acyl carrier protein [Paenibacillus arenosi]
MEIKQKVRQFIESNLIVFEEEVVFADDDHIFQMGFVNSLFAMQLLTYLEQEFEITIGNEDMDIANFSTVNSIVHLIDKHSRVV